MDCSVKRSAAALSGGLLLAAGSVMAPGGAAAQPPSGIQAPVLIYHHVKWLKPSDNAIERGLTVVPERFEAQLNFIHQAHYHVVTAAQLVARLRSGRPLAGRPLVLTFDDGYSDIYANVYRPLLRHHLRATFFIVPGFLDRPRYLTWSQVRDMAAHGMDIESHTMTHPDLTTLGVARVRWELAASRQELQNRLHRPVTLFAYPYGAYDPATQAAVALEGYAAAFTTHQSSWESSGNLLAEPRVYPGTAPVPVLTAGG